MANILAIDDDSDMALEKDGHLVTTDELPDQVNFLPVRIGNQSSGKGSVRKGTKNSAH